MSARLAKPEDNELLVSILAHPEVAKFVTYEGAPPFDPTAYTQHPYSKAVIVEGGCFLLSALEFFAYGVHTNILPEFRGAKAQHSARDALALVFLATDAEQLWTMTSDNNPQARWFAHVMGFRKQFRREEVWPVGTNLVGAQYLRMDIDDWIQAGHMAELGQAFHDLRVIQGAHPNHGEDPVHDAYVGATWAMLNNGQHAKAMRIYNRWARAAGYHPFEVLSTDPLRIDIHDCILQAQDGTFVVENKPCQQAQS